jgi:hypothetical protein
VLKNEEQKDEQKVIERNKWTVMVYLAGDNNLAEEMIYALTSMESVGSDPPHYEVFALYDAGVGPATLRIRDSKDAEKALDLVRKADNARSRAEIKKESTAKSLLQEATEEQDRIIDEIKDLSNKFKDAPAGEKKYAGPALNKKKEEAGEAEVEVLLRKDDQVMISANKAAMEKFRRARTPREAMDALDGVEAELGDSVEMTLLDFLVNTISNHPAEHYMVVLSGHGSGAVGDFLSLNRQFASLGIPDLRELLETVREEFRDRTFKDKTGKTQHYLRDKIDILGLDSCLMGMAEVAFEIRDHVDILVGAEGFEPNTGWPYDQVLRLISDNPSPTTLAKRIVREYIRFYSMSYTMSGVSTDMTALQLDAMKGFADALGGDDGLSMLLKKALLKDAAEAKSSRKSASSNRNATRDKLILAHWETQGFKNEQHIDVWDFCDRLQDHFSESSPIWKACRNVKRAVKKAVLHSEYCGPAFQHAHGVSIFFPWANITDAAGVREMDHYGSLEFAARTHWDEFVRCYHRYTQREARRGKGAPNLGTLNRREGLFTGKPPKPELDGNKFGVQGATKFGVQGGTKFGVQGGTKFGVQGGTKFGVQGGTKFELIGAGKFGLTGASKFGVVGASKFGLAGAAKFGIAGATKFGVAGGTKFGVLGGTKFGVAGGTKFGVLGGTKFTGAGNFEVFKIASMKNPPIIWFEKDDKD